MTAVSSLYLTTTNERTNEPANKQPSLYPLVASLYIELLCPPVGDRSVLAVGACLSFPACCCSNSTEGSVDSSDRFTLSCGSSIAIERTDDVGYDERLKTGSAANDRASSNSKGAAILPLNLFFPSRQLCSRAPAIGRHR